MIHGTTVSDQVYNTYISLGEKCALLGVVPGRFLAKLVA